MSKRGIDTGRDCKTQQQYKDDAKASNIVRKFIKTGVSPESRGNPLFLDLSGQMDFHEALNHVTAVQQQFMTLPPKVRLKYGNDPQNVLEAVMGINDLEKANTALLDGLIDQQSHQNMIERFSAPETPKGPNKEVPPKSAQQNLVDLSELSVEQLEKAIQEKKEG